MTTPHACAFVLVGLGMIAAPAVVPEHFGDRQMQSAIWMVFMGSLQAVGGATFLLAAGLNEARRLFALVAEALDFNLTLADFRRTVLQPSFYTLVEDYDEVAQALQLQQQLRLREVA